MKKHILSLLGTAFICSCSSYNGHYNALSTQPINLYDITRDAGHIAQGATASSERTFTVTIPFEDAPTLAEAVDFVLKKYKGHYIADVHVYRNYSIIVWPYKYNGWKIRGNVMKIY